MPRHPPDRLLQSIASYAGHGPLRWPREEVTGPESQLCLLGRVRVVRSAALGGIIGGRNAWLPLCTPASLPAILPACPPGLLPQIPHAH